MSTGMNFIVEYKDYIYENNISNKIIDSKLYYYQTDRHDEFYRGIINSKFTISRDIFNEIKSRLHDINDDLFIEYVIYNYQNSETSFFQSYRTYETNMIGIVLKNKFCITLYKNKDDYYALDVYEVKNGNYWNFNYICDQVEGLVEFFTSFIK